MFKYAFHILKSQRSRLILTVSGIGLCVLLMFFLTAIYQGVKEGSVDYIRLNKGDLWVLRANAWNILRGSSILSRAHGQFIKHIEGVAEVSPILFILAGVEEDGRKATVYLTGYDPGKSLGGPPEMAAGRPVKADDEIVLDASFARKHHYRVENHLIIQGDSLTVVGLSRHTNAFVIQYAFVTLTFLQRLIGFPNMVSCFVLRLQPGYTPARVKKEIQDELTDLAVFDQQQFLRNNIKEMEAGFLPLLYVVAVIGLVVLTTVLILLLTMNILERRLEFAVLKVLGCEPFFLPGLVMSQALIIISLAGVLALLLYMPLKVGIEALVPEISLQIRWYQIAGVLLLSIGVSLISALISQKRIRNIYPMEAFA